MRENTLPAADLGVWGAMLGVGMFCTAIAYVLYFRLIADLGPVRSLTVTFALFAAAGVALWWSVRAALTGWLGAQAGGWSTALTLVVEILALWLAFRAVAVAVVQKHLGLRHTAIAQRSQERRGRRRGIRVIEVG